MMVARCLLSVMACKVCYGFRNANVGLFLAARDNGIGQVKLDSLVLTTNFRSQAAVVDWVNTWFAPAFPHQDDISRGGCALQSCPGYP